MQSCLAGLYAEPNDLQLTREFDFRIELETNACVAGRTIRVYHIRYTSVLAPGNFAVDATQEQSQQTSFDVSQPSGFVGFETLAMCGG